MVAVGDAQRMGMPLDVGEHVVGDGDRSLHGVSVTRSYRAIPLVSHVIGGLSARTMTPSC